MVDKQGRALDMGIEPKDWMTDNDRQLSLTNTTHISLDAQKNRQIMSKALAAVGFINYPKEFWHWSYGDRYWAYVVGNSHVIYGNSFSPL